MCRIICIASALLIFTSSPAIAECGKRDASEGVSREAMDIITSRHLKLIEAQDRINLEISQSLLSRIFDPKSGKVRKLPAATLEQYRRDARYFSSLLREEAKGQRDRSEAVFSKVAGPCEDTKN